MIEEKKKFYYQSLEENNKSDEITAWMIYFANTLIYAQIFAEKTVQFLIEKTKTLDRLKDQLNDRQKKVLLKIFQKGIKGFEGGLSVGNYIAIAKTSRATATRDLQDMVEKKILVSKGILKGTRYYLKTNH